MAIDTETKKVDPKIDFMPHWKKHDQCFIEEENRNGRVGEYSLTNNQ
jgi:hypothetical protein